MIVYRLHRMHEAGMSAGFEFFASKELARGAQRAWLAGGSTEDRAADVEAIDVGRSLRGVLYALNAFASHPDNG